MMTAACAYWPRRRVLLLIIGFDCPDYISSSHIGWMTVVSVSVRVNPKKAISQLGSRVNPHTTHTRLTATHTRKFIYIYRTSRSSFVFFASTGYCPAVYDTIYTTKRKRERDMCKQGCTHIGKGIRYPPRARYMHIISRPVVMLW